MVKNYKHLINSNIMGIADRIKEEKKSLLKKKKYGSRRKR